MLLSFSTLVLQSSTMFFIQRVSFVVSFIYQWEFFIIELVFYIPTMGFLKMPQVFVSKQVGCTPTQFQFEIAYTYSSSTSIAWQSQLRALTSIDGHLHSPLIILVNMRPSPFCLLHTIPIIIFYSTHSAISMAHAQVLREG